MTGVFEELASTYEVVASLPPTGSGPGDGSSGRPGSSAPPGAADLLDIDEHERALAGVDELATFAVRLLLDEVPGIGSVPDETPGRLRLAGRWVEDLASLPDERVAAELLRDARWHLFGLRTLARRGDRNVRTGSACMDVTCRGQYVATLSEATPDLRCSVCGEKVDYERWSRWGSRTEWVSPERAATMLGLSEQAVRQRASRGRWRRRGEGREVRYHVEDVQGALSAV